VEEKTGFEDAVPSFLLPQAIRVETVETVLDLPRGGRVSSEGGIMVRPT
jgi:hypothetical protein